MDSLDNAVLDTLRANGGWMTVVQVAKAVCMPDNTYKVRASLNGLAKYGMAEKKPFTNDRGYICYAYRDAEVDDA